MIDKLSDDPAIHARQRADAYATAGWRTALVVAVWLAGVAIRPADVPAVALPIDAALALGSWWAIAAARHIAGPEFLARGHWTSFLNIPLLLGVVLAVGDAWRAFGPA